MIDSGVAFVLASISIVSIAWALRRRHVAVTGADIAATLPWFAVIGVAVAVGRSVPLSGLTAGFVQSPTVYLAVTGLVAGLWLILDVVGVNDVSRWTAVSGVLTAIAVGGASLLATGALHWRVLVWNAVAIVLAFGITGPVLRGVRDLRLSTHGWLGGGVLFAHVLDGTTTGIGLRHLGTIERNPISATIIQAGDGIGPSGVVLFLLVKIAAALLVLAVLDRDSDYVGRETAGLLVIAGGAGLLPAVHNLTLFALTIP
ncbi:DUF63 family protein [Halorubrum sp. SS7]|uniref:DUF63 family protein n=1 Tax=Halorubrum sp. SS7 TaxID=2518119 RepID=UPI0010F758E2|nr:DUF63 family protein [Halorubrum sp. SS7]TKX57304.1 DUF63 family protein [Halorubrum sp. SS7]